MGSRGKKFRGAPAATEIRSELSKLENPAQALNLRRFFKTGPGDYGAGDEFWGLKVPQVRAVLARFPEVTLGVAGALLDSPVHEVRLCGALALVRAYAQGGPDERAAVFDFYLSRTARINTLRGLLLYGYAFATIGTIAGIAAIVSWVGAVLLLAYLAIAVLAWLVVAVRTQGWRDPMSVTLGEWYKYWLDTYMKDTVKLCPSTLQ